MTFTVEVARAADGSTVTSRVRDFELTIGSRAGDFSVGFNPLETVLSAAGGCITSALGLVAANSNVAIDDVRVSVTGTREAEPPRIATIHLQLAIASPETTEKLETIVRIARRTSTVVSTLAVATDLTLAWQRLGED
jgi:putative redox protein